MTAPLVVDAAMNGEIFLPYLEQCLVPTLSPGEIVTMDNLPAHASSPNKCRLSESRTVGIAVTGHKPANESPSLLK